MRTVAFTLGIVTGITLSATYRHSPTLNRWVFWFWTQDVRRGQS